MNDYCEQYSRCNNTLLSQLTKFNDDDHVILVNDTIEVFIEEQVGKCGKIPLYMPVWLGSDIVSASCVFIFTSQN